MTGNQPCNDDDREIQTDTGERATERERMQECERESKRGRKSERENGQGVEGDEMMMEGKADTKKN